MKIKITWQYIIAFICLIILCGTSHEFAHHFSGALICGSFGYKTFNSFVLADGCQNNPYAFLATAIGPAFTYLLMWIGLYRLQKADEKNRQLGFALIFANFPINRIFFALIHSNDEQWIARHLYGNSDVAFWATNALIWLCTLPPLFFAYKAIKNKHRILWFTAFFVLPFIFVFLFAGLFLENFLLLKERFLAETVLGIPFLILVTEVISLIGYYSMQKHIYSPIPETGKAALGFQLETSGNELK